MEVLSQATKESGSRNSVDRFLLLLILVYGVATIWIRERWALSVLEAGVFLSAAAASARVFLRSSGLRAGFLPLAFAGMAVWGIVQLAAGWTVVKADTVDAVLYWLAAACLVWLAWQVCSSHDRVEWFLGASAITGSVICLIGLLHLYTSDGLVFWIFSSGYNSRIPGPFTSRNNYAAFVELLLPVALVLAMKRRPGSRSYVVLSAALVAVVIASGSRAGVVLVGAEVAIVFLLARGHGALLAAFAGLVALFVGVVGYQYLWERFVHDSDPYLMRREFLESTLAMIRAQPLHGFGLGAWASAYPQFAVIDVGKFANHAHNEWAQWAAEGGLPALAVMLVVFLWTVRAAVQSVWGIGLAAVMVHSLVDYPFMRLGLAGWIFVLLGVLEADRRRRRSAPVTNGTRWRIVSAAAVPVLMVCAFYTARLGWADTLYRRGTLNSLQRAVQLGPGRAEYELSLAQADPDDAARHLQRATALNPSATGASIQLAAEVESRGDLARAERILVEAAAHDRQFAPAWALANFYFRSGRPEKVWPWVTAAVKVYRGDLRPLFDLCFLVSDGADSALEPIVARRPDAERQFLSYLLEHQRLPAARATALQIANRAEREDRDVLLDYVDAELAAGNAAAAWEIWRQLCRDVVPCEAASTSLSNGDFGRPILNRGFDWLLPPVPGVVATQIRDGVPALSLSLSGKEPEFCVVLAHFLSLPGRARYTVRFEYRTTGLPPHTGLYWSAGVEPAYQFDSAEKWSAAQWSFLSSGETGRLSLSYGRYPGTTRLEGTLLLRNVRLERGEPPVRRAEFSFP